MVPSPPSPVCCICNKTLEETGGSRVYHSRNCGTMIVPLPSNLSLPEPECIILTETMIRSLRCSGWIRLTGPMREFTLVWWGNNWPPEIIQRLIDTAQNQLSPWFCQRCANVGICSTCGNPLEKPPGAEILDDNGKGWHVPVFAGMMGCKVCKADQTATQ